MNKQIVGVTMGDPAGVGPEICLKAAVQPDVVNEVAVLLIGDQVTFETTYKRLQLTAKINYLTEETLQKRSLDSDAINILLSEYQLVTPAPLGKGSRQGAAAAMSAISRAMKLADDGLIDVVATSPINKNNFAQAGFKLNNHTAMFRDHYPDRESTSMFHCRDLKVFHYTRHMSLKKAIAAINVKDILTTIEKDNRTLIALGYKEPKIAIAALNPHSSDNGLYGDEEREYLIPAIAAAKREGINAFGPVPADSVFYQQRIGKYDAVLSLYHDQGHIACKTLDFNRSVSLTFGLPYVRSTVDHGTAYDIAGQGIASSKNLEEAIVVAARYQDKINQAKKERSLRVG